jgi:alpha-ketoglutarate-dependent taurine dioxygenase
MTEIGATAAVFEAFSIGSRLSPAGGVEITGADLSRPLSPDRLAAVLAAFRERHILVFRARI